jgi:hypothetical protein
MLFASFNQNGRPNEAHLSSGDSAGALFIDDAGVWKLAGINYAVDGPFYTDAAGGGAFLGALFDKRGFYEGDAPPYAPVTGDAAVPSGFYSTRLSSKRAWIDSVIGPGMPNISSRAFVDVGVDATIAGFIVRGDRRKILFRALGPSLAAHLTGTLLDPELELHDGNGTLITSNDNWPDAPNRDEIIASTLSPTDTRESVIFVATPPGNYTAIVRSAGAATGIGLLELYLFE